MVQHLGHSGLIGVGDALNGGSQETPNGGIQVQPSFLRKLQDHVEPFDSAEAWRLNGSAIPSVETTTRRPSGDQLGL